jgi:GTP-dependent phosphoenolpyruvate carboxykinase
MTVTEAFSDVADVIAHLNPTQIVAIKASKKMSERVEQLVSKKKNSAISIEETLELERFLALDLFISLAKARARLLLAA